MRRKGLWMLLLCACLAATGCAQQVAVEAEGLALKDCRAMKLGGASGGRAVFMTTDGGEARGTVDLRKGKYEVVVYVQGTNDEGDAVFVTVCGKERRRVWGGDHGSVVAATLYETEERSFAVTIEKDGPCEVVLQMAEPNVYVDRVVFRAVAK